MEDKRVIWNPKVDAYHAAAWSCHPVTNSRGKSLALAGKDSWASGTLPEQGTPAHCENEMRRFPLSEAPLFEHALSQVSHGRKSGFSSGIREQTMDQQSAPRCVHWDQHRSRHVNAPRSMMSTLQEQQNRIACCTATTSDV